VTVWVGESVFMMLGWSSMGWGFPGQSKKYLMWCGWDFISAIPNVVGWGVWVAGVLGCWLWC
jgi:hypothetical protein